MACHKHFTGWARRYVPQDAEGRGRIQQYARNALDRFLHSKRLALVSRARDLLMASDQETVLVGMSLPANSEAGSAQQAAAGKGALCNQITEHVVEAQSATERVLQAAQVFVCVHLNDVGEAFACRCARQGGNRCSWRCTAELGP
jgi:hypothetical protein